MTNTITRTEKVSSPDEFRRVLQSLGMTGDRAPEMYRNLSAMAAEMVIGDTRIVFK